MDTIDQVLKEARTLLGEKGELWVKSYGWRTRQPSPYHCCVLTAIWNAVHNQAGRWPDPDLLFQRVLDRFMKRNGVADVPKWNDYPQRTFTEVDEAFKRSYGEMPSV